MFGCNCPYGCTNGVCQKRICKCDLYWEGDACQRRVLSKYVGDYSGTNTCESDQIEFSLKNGKSVDELIWNQDITLTYSDSDRFDILQQNYKGVQISGQGSMLLEKISFRISSIDSNDTLECFVSANLKKD